jgi:DNA-binding transcriptional LysR family regulator
MGDMDVNQLRSFVAVAGALNITRAAKRLHLAQQAVSVHVQRLERTLGATLLIRTSRGVELTPAGHQLATKAKDILDDLDELAAQVRLTASGRRGKLRLVCTPHATAEFAVEVAETMKSALPGVEVELITVSTVPEELDLLHTDEGDVSFLWLPAHADDLRAESVRTDRRMVALPRTHKLANREAVTLADLADEPVIGPGAARIEDRLMLVASGLGVWLAPEPLSRQFLMPQIAWLPVTDAPPSHLAVVWTSRAPQSLVTRLIAEVRKLTNWTGHAPLSMMIYNL